MVKSRPINIHQIVTGTLALQAQLGILARCFSGKDPSVFGLMPLEHPSNPYFAQRLLPAIVMLTDQQIGIVKATVPVIAQHGNAVTTAFYKNLLHDKPSLNVLFNQGNPANGHQAKALATAVYAYAANIDDLGAQEPAIAHITQKHASLFIRPAAYNDVGTCLLAALAQVLSDAFTPEIRDAWTAAYGQLANIMIAAEAELYKKREFWQDWRDFVIEDKIKESSEITSLIFTPVDGRMLPSHAPGQYISARVDVPQLKYPQIRQYSLSDKPSENTYRISVRRDPGVREGDVTPSLCV